MGEAVKSADRVLRILELLTDRPEGLTLTEIRVHLDLPKSSTHSLLATMTSRGFLSQDPRTRAYRVGIRLWQAGQSYPAVSDLERLALPYMETLRDQLKETVQLAILDGIENVYVGKVDSDQPLRLESRVGARLPAHATGIGKALLSGLSDAQLRERFHDVTFTRFTPRTIGSYEALAEEIAAVRAAGYATDNSEYTPGVFCVAAPIRGPQGEVRAAVSVSLPDVRKSPAFIERIMAAVPEQAAAISLRLGFSPVD